MRTMIARMIVVSGAVTATAVLGLGSVASASQGVSTQEPSTRVGAIQPREVSLTYSCHKGDYCGPHGDQPACNVTKWRLMDLGQTTGQCFYEGDPLAPRGVGWYVYWYPW